MKNMKVLYTILFFITLLLPACKNVSYVPPVASEQLNSSQGPLDNPPVEEVPPTPTEEVPPTPNGEGPTVTVSGIWQNDKSGVYAGSMAFDNDDTTRWASNNDGSPTWILINLKSATVIARMAISWQYIGYGYRVEVSADGVDYSTVRTVTLQESASDRYTEHDFSRNELGGVYAQYIRISAIESDSVPYRSIVDISFVDANENAIPQ